MIIRMNLKLCFLTLLSASAVAAGLSVSAQTQTTPAATPAPAAAPSAASAPADATPKPWRIGPMDVTGFADGFYTFNNNHPTNADNGQSNNLYNFNDTANVPDLSAVKLTLNHDPGKLGAHIDVLYGRTNTLINQPGQLEYVEQAYLSTKPPSAKGLELDLGKFVTSAGAEVIEAKDNWNYSRSVLFAWAIPYWHFGLRSSMPVSKTETLGVQVVNGWNNITNSTGGVTVGVTSALVKTKYTWNVNFYTGPENTSAQHAFRNLIDTTVLFTPNTKFNWYLNYDFGDNDNKIANNTGNSVNSTWQGLALAAHDQFSTKMAVALRGEFFNDGKGYSTGLGQNLGEFTGTYEYKWKYGLMSRAEFRKDWSDHDFFNRGNGQMVKSQTTATLALILVLAPHQ